MKKQLIGVCLLIAAFVGCSKSAPLGSPLGNGFYLRRSGVTPELHPKRISLCQLRADGRAVEISPALSVSGGPFLLGDGIIFCAWNEAGKVALFVANSNGIVSEVTAHVQPGLDNDSEINYVSVLGETVTVKLFDASGKRLTVNLAKSELIRIAQSRITNGQKIRLGKFEFYR